MTMEFRPLWLQDSVALRTAWTPLKFSGASYRNKKLVHVQPLRIELRGTLGDKLLACVAFAAAVWFLLYAFDPEIVNKAIWHSRSLHWRPWFARPLAAVVGLLWAMGALLWLRFACAPLVFDRALGAYWRGRRMPCGWWSVWASRVFLAIEQSQASETLASSFGQLTAIHAVQVIPKMSQAAGRVRSQPSYEMNLIMADGSRLGVLAHQDLQSMKTDAAQLGVFLGRPVWNVADKP